MKKNIPMGVLIFVFAALFLNFCAQVYGFISHRALFGDSSYYLLKILVEEKFVDTGLLRYSLLQAPAIFLRILDAPMTVITRIYEASLGFHSILSLAVCFYFLKRRKREDLFIFPLLSFAICTQIIYPFTKTTGLDVLSLFWPALLYFVLPKNPNPVRWLDYFVMTFLLTGMILSHESGAAALLLILSLAVSEIRKDTNRREFCFFVVAISGSGIAWLLKKPFVLPYPGTGPSALERFPNDTLPLLSAAAVLLLSVCLIFKEAKLSKLLIPVLALAPLLYFIFPGDPWISDARAARFLVIPLASLLGGMLLMDVKTLKQTWLYLFVAVFLAAFTFRDLQITTKWAKYYKYLQDEVHANTGCVLINMPEIEGVDTGELRPWTVPILSLILQGSRLPTTLLFAKKPGHDSEYCNLARKGGLIVNRYKYDIKNYFSVR